MPQIPGSRRVLPFVLTPATVEHVRRLLHQGDAWVPRARWDRWLRGGDEVDTIPIASMTADERLAARVWLRQQRHPLHRALGGDGLRAPDDWVASLPLDAALQA